MIGILVGVIATVLVSHYYFCRSTRRCLKAYLVVDTQIFAGIEPEVREQLHFAFRGEEVRDLHQVEFLVANAGERAISGLIEPLRLRLPAGVKVLDALILHRSPDALEASVTSETEEVGDEGATVTIKFPLLNKHEYFLVKVLLGGRVKTEHLAFSVLADDLPRSINFELLPHRALHEKKLTVDWSALVAAAGLLGLAASMVWALWLLAQVRPDLFPYPWASFRFSLAAAAIWPAGIVILLLVLLAVLIAAAGSADVLARGPRFPIPSRLRTRVGFRQAPFGSDSGEIRDLEDLPSPQKSPEPK